MAACRRTHACSMRSNSPDAAHRLIGQWRNATASPSTTCCAASPDWAPTTYAATPPATTDVLIYLVRLTLPLTPDDDPDILVPPAVDSQPNGGGHITTRWSLGAAVRPVAPAFLILSCP